MTKLILVLMSGLLLVTVGCSHTRASKKKAPATPTTTTEFTPNREQKVQARAEELQAKGIPADQALRLARGQIPVMQTTTSQPANVEKERKAQEKFEKDLSKSLNPR
jgi:heme-binding NEAT domain protein